MSYRLEGFARSRAWSRPVTSNRVKPLVDGRQRTTERIYNNNNKIYLYIWQVGVRIKYL